MARRQIRRRASQAIIYVGKTFGRFSKRYQKATANSSQSAKDNNMSSNLFW